MNIKLIYYLDVVASWCYWAEPAWAELKQRYAKRPVEFGWQIALLDAESMSKSRDQSDWFYRRSGTIVRSPFIPNGQVVKACSIVKIGLWKSRTRIMERANRLCNSNLDFS